MQCARPPGEADYCDSLLRDRRYTWGCKATPRPDADLGYTSRGDSGASCHHRRLQEAVLDAERGARRARIHATNKAAHNPSGGSATSHAFLSIRTLLMVEGYLSKTGRRSKPIRLRASAGRSRTWHDVGGPDNTVSFGLLVAAKQGIITSSSRTEQVII